MPYADALFKHNFLHYASYVIKERAIPHVDDGLKPVQRRILHSLFEVDDGKFHKVANVVGHCMKYHPHGDASIYEALVNIANRDILIDKQGNFGNPITGDQASAARYIECRVTPFAKAVLYNPELTSFEPSYDGRNKEPLVFPAKIPLILVQGAEGIAVGMSTRILPHNLHEVVHAVQAKLRGKHVQLYPDFNSGGLIDVSDYQDGHGKILTRALLDTKDPKKIVIREIPFGTTTESLIASIEGAARKGKLKIASIDDYTGENVEIEIKLPKGVYTKDLVDQLFAHTDCEYSISVNLLVIHNEKPVNMTVTEIIEHHARRLVELLTQELQNEQKHLKDLLHARTLEQIFVEERIYKRIEEERTASGVIKTVQDGFIPFMDIIKREVTVEDVERLLRIPIRRISLYDIEKAKKEMAQIRDRLKEIARHLKNIVEYAVGYLDELLAKAPVDLERKTRITSFSKIDVKDVANREHVLRFHKDSGYVGMKVDDGIELGKISEFDKILIIRKNGSYTVVDAPDKLYVGDIWFCGLAEKDRLVKLVFSAVYSNKEKQTYVKRFKIEQFIKDRDYTILPDETDSLHLLTTKEDAVIQLEYKPKPNLRVLEQEFPLADYIIKGVKAGGTRLSTKELKRCRLLTATSGKPAPATKANPQSVVSVKSRKTSKKK